MTLSIVTVTGTMLNGAALPQGASIAFAPTSDLTDLSGENYISSDPVIAVPDEWTGEFTAELIATDNPNVFPLGWLWTVTVTIGIKSASFTTGLPSSPSTVDITDLMPSGFTVNSGNAGFGPVSVPGVSYLPQSGGPLGGTVTLEGSPPFRVPGATSGQVLVADSLGNFTAQASPPGGIGDVTVSGTPVAGDTIIAGGGTTAVWQLPLQADTSDSPRALGTASPGTGPGVSPADHVHPVTGLVDTSSTQGVAGNKTFSGTTTFSGPVTVPGTGLIAGSAAPKSYVDSVAAGLSPQGAAAAATLSTESYTYTISGGSVTAVSSTTIDGVTLTAGQYLLIKDCPATTGGTGSANSSQPGNGLYVVSSASGSLSVSRAAGMSGSNTPIAAFVFVTGTTGSASKGAGYVVTTPAGGSGAFTYGTGAIQWGQFSSASSVSADGTTLTQAGSVISLTVPVTVARGGTNAITQQAAINNLAGAVTNQNYLRGNGTNVSMSALAAADLTGTVQLANGGTNATSAAAAITNLGAADLTSAQTLTAKTLKNTSLTFDNLGTVTTSQSLLTSNGNVQKFTLGATVAVTAITGPGGATACDLTLYIQQASSGGPFSISSWPGSVTWLGGSQPTIQQGTGAITVVTFESLNGGTSWYGAQITGAPSLPLTVALGGTGATDSNGALEALAGPGVLGIFGTGGDGAVVFNGTNTFSFATSGTNSYTLNRDVQATSVTVSSGVTVRTSSASGTFRIFCRGPLVAGGTITAAGNAASGATAGAQLASGSLVGGRVGGTGGAAGTGGGGTPGNASFGIAGGAGGNGGGGVSTGSAGGTASIPGSSAVANIFNSPFPLLNGMCGYGGLPLQIGFGPGGGGGGGAAGNAGGGGGSGGGIVAIFAYTVTNTGTITAAGGNGGAAAGGNAAGGGGGSGGLIIAYTLSGWTNTGTTTVTGGTAGASSGSATASAAGGAGNVLNVVLTS